MSKDWHKVTENLAALTAAWLTDWVSFKALNEQNLA